MHHDTMDVVSLQIVAGVTGGTRQGGADVRLVRAPLETSSHCNKQLRDELADLAEDPMAAEVMLQAVSGLRVVTRRLRPLVEPALEDHCAVVRGFELLYEGRTGQKMLGKGALEVERGKPKIPSYKRVSEDILNFAHGSIKPINKLEHETVPPFDPEVLAGNLV